MNVNLNIKASIGSLLSGAPQASDGAPLAFLRQLAKALDVRGAMNIANGVFLRKTLSWAVCVFCLGFTISVSAQTPVYSTGTPGTTCGTNPSWYGSAPSGQEVCDELAAWVTTQEPTCAVPGVISSSTFSGGVTGGSCAIVCQNQTGGNCSSTLPVTVSTSAISTEDLGTPPPATPPVTAGDPLILSIGNKLQTAVDYQAPGPNALQFVRYYNSVIIGSSAANFALGWMHNYAATINTIASAGGSVTAVSVTRGDGKAYTFNQVSGIWTPNVEVNDKLVQLFTGPTVTGWQYTNATNDSLETYDAYGNLLSIAYREGTTVTLTYAVGSGAPVFPGQLLSVTDSFGRTLSFTYLNNILHTMKDPAGGLYTYSLGALGSSVLSSVTYPDTYSESYLYNESAYTNGQNLPFALTGVIDENQSRYTTTSYGTGGAATQTQLAPALSGSVGLYNATNTLDGTGRIQSVSLVDPLGATRGRTFVSSAGRNRLASATQPAANGSPAGSMSWSYDANGNIAETIDLAGNVTCAAFDLLRNLETGRVEGMAAGSTCPSTIATYTPASGTVQRKILTQWHSIWHLPIKRAQPLKITTWVYNGDSGAFCAPTTAKVGVNPIGVVCSRSEQGTTDATGGAGFGATAAGSPRVWSYTYNSFGQVLTVDGPRTVLNDVTTYTYYSCTTGGKCGQINTITSAASANAPSGLVTTFLTYDAHGNPLTVTGPNGVLTTLTYDARERLLSRQVGSETTAFTYWPTGLLKVVMLPDSSTILYGYDNAHRLTDITDGVGNHIHYTLDASGNRIADNTYDASTVQRRTHTRMFNTLSELYQDINAANSSLVTTTYGYDAQGNLQSIAAPMSRNTGLLYDELNRVKQITDPMAGVTNSTYDGNDNFVSVKDPRLFPTTYTLNGFNEVTQLVSRDTGTSSSTFDTSGNLKTTTDARGAGATYSYDALNRVSQIAYTDQTFNFTYDTGTNGLGRLSGASDASHSMSWAYDTLGRVTAKGQTVAGVTRSVGYGYTNGDMNSLTTPSGQSVVYGYTNHRITSITVNGTTVLNNVTYDPFGSSTGWTWGNATTTSRSFDLDGNPAQIIAAGATYTYTPDSASRIQTISDSIVPANSFTFGYDNLDRVGSATSSAISRGYTYDANTNRLTTTGPTSTENVGTLTNRLNSISGTPARAYTYDSAGNTLTFTGETFTFNQRGRMSTAVSSAGTTAYVYNALGQMIEKSGNGGTTLLVYDEAGHILGEYSSTGALVQETIWMGDTPVATLRLNGSAGCSTTSAVCIFYVHTDHLGTPRKVTRALDNVQMWRWDPDTFGSVTPTGLGLFSYKLRFPGMYALNESGLFYNYFRDYDPQTGRYIESDPIGLRGGINTYAYSNGNPVTNFDPTGLASCGFFDCPSLPQGVVNASAGIGDALLLNQGARLRQLLNINGGVDTCSSSYNGGQLAGVVATLATGEGEVTILSNAAHYAPRLIEAGVDVAEAQAAVVGELKAMQAALAKGESLGSLSQRMTVGGKLVQYNAYPLPGGIINVGTIFPVL